MLLFRLKNTYSVIYRFVLFFLLMSFLVRLALLIITIKDAGLTPGAFFRIFGEGMLFDFGVAAFFCLPYAFYLLLLPVKLNDTILNRTLTYVSFFLAVLVTLFSFFAEFTFWDEFGSRFNFIAVDYLVYTYEVVNNINESYPLPLLIGGMLLLSLLVTGVFKKRKYFKAAFHGESTFPGRLLIFVLVTGICMVYAFKINNSFAEQGKNRYQDELAKAGIYSFFSAFKNNGLSYDHFYKLIDSKEAFFIVRNQLSDEKSRFYNNDLSIKRNIINPGLGEKPNVIMVTIESFSADFMARFGNNKYLTPTLDSLARESIIFTNMYATGSRTVRGMEALSLAVPPTPGSSIVRRPGSDHLTTIGSIFKAQGYATSFFYGGDGYFDNMNQYFGSNGYAVTDRGRNLLSTDQFESPRKIIADSLVHFENAWGIADEDLYDAVINDADEKFKQGKLFYDFIMTTSNHRPYTYPPGKIGIASGTGRDGAVKYTDYAIGQFFKKIQSKPWFANTVFIFVADHCAGSAGKNEIDIAKYHIPAMIYNLKSSSNITINKLCSQIDLYPTLFSLLNWNYTSNLYGRDVLSEKYEPRILLGTYQKLAYLKNDSLVILSPQQKAETFLYNQQSNEQVPALLPNLLIHQAIANYQTAYYLFNQGGLKQKQ